jgi:S1-C subfamily serine protease
MADALSSLSEALVAAVDAASPSIVRVEARRRLPASGVVWSADGVIVTSHHVVERDEGIEIGLHSGDVVPATLAGRDPSTDIAVLRADSSSLTAPTWSDDTRVGHLVLALGRPGQQVQATLGVVSALGEAGVESSRPRRERYRGGRRGPRPTADVLFSRGDVSQFIQTDVVMYPGFSGGPLVGANGQILGLNTSALMPGISLTVRTGTIRRVVEALLAHGRIRRGYLGVGVQPARLPEKLAEELEQETGALVVSVEPGSPAEQGGLFLGDTIISLDGQTVHDLDDLLASLTGDRVGKQVSVRIVRGGQVQELRATIGERQS